MSLPNPLPSNTRIFSIYEAATLKTIYSYPNDDLQVIERVNQKVANSSAEADPLTDTTLLMRRLGQLSNMIPAETSPYFPHQFCLNHCTGNGAYTMTTLIIPQPGLYLVYSQYRMNGEKNEKKKVKRERSAINAPSERQSESSKERRKKEEKAQDKSSSSSDYIAPGSAEKKPKKTQQTSVVAI
jgi:hypothetical protein